MKAFSTVMLVAVLAVAAVCGFVREYSGDFHYHLVMGEKTLHLGHVYRIDDLSHTFAGTAMTPSAWLGDVVLALGFRAAGYAGDYGLRALCLVLLVWFLAREMEGSGLGRAATAVMLLVLLAQSCLVFYLRPEMFAYALFAALYFCLSRYRKTSALSYLAALLAILTAWANLHGSVVLGVMLVGLFAAELAVRRVRMLALVPLAVVATMANPNGYHALLAGQILNPSYLAHTAEWAPLRHFPSLVMVAYGFTAIAVIADWRRMSPYRLAMAVILTAMALRHQRFLTFALITLGPLAAHHAGALRIPSRIKIIALAAVTATAMTVMVFERRLFAEIGTSIDRQSYPIAACNHVRRNPPAGNLLNNYDYGSYLLYCQPAKVFIDQRAWSLYPEAFYRRYLNAPSNLPSLTKDYDIGWAFLKYDPIAAAMAKDPRHWALTYFDDQTLIYVNQSQTPTAFEYLTPFHPESILSLKDKALEVAKQELQRQQQQAPNAYKTHLFTAAVAVATSDDNAYKRAEVDLRSYPLSATALIIAADYARKHNQPARAAALEEAAQHL